MWNDYGNKWKEHLKPECTNAKQGHLNMIQLHQTMYTSWLSQNGRYHVILSLTTQKVKVLLTNEKGSLKVKVLSSFTKQDGQKGLLRAVRTASARSLLMKNWLCSVSSIPRCPPFPFLLLPNPNHFSSANGFVISNIYSASAVISVSEMLVFCG